MDVKLPNLGEGADSGTVVNLFVKEGDQIEKDQPHHRTGKRESGRATIPSTAAGMVTKFTSRPATRSASAQRIISLAKAAAARRARCAKLPRRQSRARRQLRPQPRQPAEAAETP